MANQFVIEARRAQTGLWRERVAVRKTILTTYSAVIFDDLMTLPQ